MTQGPKDESGGVRQEERWNMVVGTKLSFQPSIPSTGFRVEVKVQFGSGEFRCAG